MPPILPTPAPTSDDSNIGALHVLLEFEGSGHVPTMTRPNDVVNTFSVASRERLLPRPIDQFDPVAVASTRAIPVFHGGSPTATCSIAHLNLSRPGSVTTRPHPRREPRDPDVLPLKGLFLTLAHPTTLSRWSRRSECDDGRARSTHLTAVTICSVARPRRSRRLT